jgi:hypothetical protein
VSYVEIAALHDGLGLLQLLEIGQEVLVPLLSVPEPVAFACVHSRVSCVSCRVSCVVCRVCKRLH